MAVGLDCGETDECGVWVECDGEACDGVLLLLLLLLLLGWWGW